MRQALWGLIRKKAVVKKKLILLVASLAMPLVSTAALALAQGPGDLNEVRCLLPEGCGPISDDELLCLLPEGCDIDGDGVPDLRAGEPVSPVGALQYDNTP